MVPRACGPLARGSGSPPPCGEGSGVGVSRAPIVSGLPPSPPSPARGEGVHRRRGERRLSNTMHGTPILEETDRLMTVCNSCRYCEGLCAVFPAMEMRFAFADGDLNYLANLCHGCGACYVDCQFRRRTSSTSMCRRRWPSRATTPMPPMPGRMRCPGLFARNGVVISVIAALSVAAFIFGFAAGERPGRAVGVHTGPGAFYKLMPHNAMAALFGAAFLYAILASGHERARILARHRRADRGPRQRRFDLAGDPRCRRAALSRWRRRRLLQCGRATDRPPQDLSII